MEITANIVENNLTITWLIILFYLGFAAIYFHLLADGPAANGGSHGFGQWRAQSLTF